MQITELCNKYAEQINEFMINDRIVAKLYEIVDNKTKQKIDTIETDKIVKYKEKSIELFKNYNGKSEQSLKDIKDAELMEKNKDTAVETFKKYTTEKIQACKIYQNKGTQCIFFEETNVNKNTTKKISGQKRKCEFSNESEHVKRKKLFINYAGFKDDDFHIINDTDESWICNDNGHIEKNEILTELIISEKEIKMINFIKKYVNEN